MGKVVHCIGRFVVLGCSLFGRFVVLGGALFGRV